jgi:pimeloyl-ACP methyl ester carboxylesterase
VVPPDQQVGDRRGREVRATLLPRGAFHRLAQDTGPRVGGHRPLIGIARPPSATRAVSAAVVLIHGFTGSSTRWFAVPPALRADGRTVVSFDYPPWASSVDGLADRLIETVEDVLAATGRHGPPAVQRLDPIVPAHRAVPANRQATRVMIDAAGHCGVLLDPEVIERIVTATALREEAADLGAPLAAGQRRGGSACSALVAAPDRLTPGPR